ncbi:DsrE family protein [Brevundimonas sp. Marseille-Q4549]
MKRSVTPFAVVAIAAALAMASAAHAQAVPGFGAFTTPPGAGELPDPQRAYKVIFDLAQGGPDDQPLKNLQRVARLANILETGGVSADHRHIVVVIHGGATPAILTDAACNARGRGPANPNRPLIRALLDAGIEIRLCGQSMTASSISSSEIEPGVSIDVAAMMTVI